MIKKMLFILPFILALANCSRVITYKSGDKTIRYENYGFDTKIGVMHIKTEGGGEIHLENLDSTSQSLQIANKAIDLANSKLPTVP